MPFDRFFASFCSFHSTHPLFQRSLVADQLFRECESNHNRNGNDSEDDVMRKRSIHKRSEVWFETGIRWLSGCWLQKIWFYSAAAASSYSNRHTFFYLQKISDLFRRFFATRQQLLKFFQYFVLLVTTFSRNGKILLSTLWNRVKKICTVIDDGFLREIRAQKSCFLVSVIRK